MERLIGIDDGLAHAVLVSLSEDEGTRKRALQILNQLEPYVCHLGFPENIRPLTRTCQYNGTKRKAGADVLICEQCNNAYTEEENSVTACSYHEGELEPDDDFWAEDPNPYLDLDSQENRENFPEGFFWNCCGVHGDENEACMTGRHISSQKRLNMAPNGSTSLNGHHQEDFSEHSQEEESEEAEADFENDDDAEGEDDDEEGDD